MKSRGFVGVDQASSINEVVMTRDYLMSLQLDNVPFHQEAQSDATVPVQDKVPRRPTESEADHLMKDIDLAIA